MVLSDVEGPRPRRVRPPPRPRGPRAGGSRGSSGRRPRPSLDPARDGPEHRRRATARHRSWSHASRYRSRCGSVSTHCRTGTRGKTWSTTCAARSAMRRPPSLDLARDGPEPRRRAAARTARPGLARERDQPVETTVVATETGEAAGQPAAAQELAEFPPPPRLRRGSPERCARRRPARRTGAVLLRRADRPPGRGTSRSDRGPPDTAHPARASAARTPSRPRHARRIPGATRPDAGRLRKSAERTRQMGAQFLPVPEGVRTQILPAPSVRSPTPWWTFGRPPRLDGPSAPADPVRNTLRLMPMAAAFAARKDRSRAGQVGALVAGLWRHARQMGVLMRDDWQQDARMNLFMVKLAEREGFEPSVEFPLHTLSKRAPSASRSSLRDERGCRTIVSLRAKACGA